MAECLELCKHTVIFARHLNWPSHGLENYQRILKIINVREKFNLVVSGPRWFGFHTSTRFYIKKV